MKIPKLIESGNNVPSRPRILFLRQFILRCSHAICVVTKFAHFSSASSATIKMTRLTEPPAVKPDRKLPIDMTVISSDIIFRNQPNYESDFLHRNNITMETNEFYPLWYYQCN